MINKIEKEEKEYLKNLLKQVAAAIRFTNKRIQSQSDEVQYLNNHLQEYKTDMDHLEKNAISVAFGSGIVITTAHLAKGLEFDQVIVPFCTDKNYHTNTDRQMLYVACTRAMHNLFLTHVGNASPFLKN